MNQLGSFEDVIEKGQSSVRNAAKSAQQGATNFAKTTSGQTSNSTLSDTGVNETNNASAQQQMSDDDAQKFLQDLYGVKNTNQNPQNPIVPPAQKPTASQQSVKAALGFTDSGGAKRAPTPKETIKAAFGIPESKPAGPAPSAKDTIKNALGIPEIGSNQKTSEEQAKILALRNQLHGEYYQKLTKPQQQAEESVVDKLEREDQEKKMEDLETNKEKPPPVNPTMKQGTAETVVGVSG